jgi:hypothetical protein
VADVPTASDTLGVIPVVLFRHHRGQGGPSAFHMLFAVVQTDWKWITWYLFVDSVQKDKVLLETSSLPSASDIYRRGFGRTHHEFRRKFLHLTKDMRVDGVIGDNLVKAPALMFARNSPKKDGSVLVGIDIQRTDGLLQLLRLHLEGNIQKEFNGKSTRGGRSSGGAVPKYSIKRN